jgi:valyl-tRNA synthetase
MEELTQEQIERSVSASYDSVNLINELNLKETKTEEDLDSIDRNKEHIKIMLSKDWFVSALTPEQKSELEGISK